MEHYRNLRASFFGKIINKDKMAIVAERIARARRIAWTAGLGAFVITSGTRKHAAKENADEQRVLALVEAE
jgi:hypothetical protein